MTAAPLIATDAAPIPEGGEAFWVEGAGGARLRAAIFPALGATRGSVVLSAGRTEPIEKYFEVIGELQDRGFTVLAHDWRGQGLSHRMLPDRLRGHADGHADFLEDLRLLLDQAGGRLPRPWIALGHSMGCLTALAVTQGAARFDGVFLSAPMMGLTAVKPVPRPVWMIAKAMISAGRGADYVVKEGFSPTPVPFAANILTHDQRRYERYTAQLSACPDLMIGGVTWGWLAFALETGFLLGKPSAAASIACPLTIVAAGDDRLVLNAPARRFAERAPQGRYVEIPGAFHEVLMETDDVRAVVWGEFDALAALVCRPAQELQGAVQTTPVA